jgi:hypothetical protein
VIAPAAPLALALAAIAAAAGGGGPAPAVHAVAFVNDPLSHGLVGDGLLSLNEAIRLHNGTLPYATLSPAEQAQLSLIPNTGNTTDVTWIDIDGSNTPVITIEQDLDPVLDTSFGLLLKGFGDRPVLDFSGPGITHGLRVPANAMSVQDLVFLAGPYGIDVVQTDVSGQAGCTLQGVRFEGQAQFGLRVSATTANGVGRMILEQCEFDGCPTAIVHDESGPGRTSIVEAHEVDVRNASTGFDATLGPGGSTRYTFDRVTIDASVRGIRIARSATASRQAFLEGSFVQIRAPEAAVLQCHPVGQTWALLHLWDLRAGPGGTALQLGAPGDALFGELTEATLDGAVQVGCGAAPQPLRLVNLRCRTGPVGLATSPSQPLTVTDSRFDGCAVSTTGNGPVAVNGCCFAGGTLIGTAAAPLQLTASFAVAVGAHVSVAAPLPAPQLGSLTIAPDYVVLGGTVQFLPDLPPGLLGVLALGFTDPSPTLAVPGLHLYFEPATYVLLPGAYTLQQGTTWNVPANSIFAGTDLVVQLAALPLAGVQAPWLQLPPPVRFVLR